MSSETRETKIVGWAGVLSTGSGLLSLLRPATLLSAGLGGLAVG
jgi:hypothetical protein